MGMFTKGKKVAARQAQATEDAARQQAEAMDRQAAAAERSAAAAADATRLAAEMQRQGAEDNARAIAEAAAAAERSAARQAQADRDNAAAAQQGRETMIAQNVASEKARETLAKPTGTPEVTLAADDGDKAEIDPDTGRRRPTRAAFMSKRSAAGISI